MTPEDRKRVEKIRRYFSNVTVPQIPELLAILDRVDPPPPPEQIVISEAAKAAFWLGMSRAPDSRAANEYGLRAAFKVILADLLHAAIDLGNDPFTFDRPARWYRVLTGEEWPHGR